MNIMRFVIPKSLVEYVTVDSTLRQAIEKMKYHRYVAIPVIDKEGAYIGTLRNDDILNYLISENGYDMKAAEKTGVVEIMDESYVRPVYHNATMETLFERVKEHNFVPVVDDRGCFIGIILRRNILDILIKFYNDNDRGKK